MDFKYTSIILAKRDVSEVDRIYIFYTKEEGKVQAMGRGVRKPNSKLAGNLEPLTYCELYVSKKKGMGRITGVAVLDSFISIKESLDAISRVFMAIGYFEKLITQQEKDEEIFGLLLSYLLEMGTKENISGGKTKMEVITLGFLIKLLERMGYRIVADVCVSCGGTILAGNGNFFSAEKGGVLCPDCASREIRKIRCSDSAIKLFRIFLGNKISNFSKLSIAENDLRNFRAVFDEMIRWIV